MYTANRQLNFDTYTEFVEMKIRPRRDKAIKWFKFTMLNVRSALANKDCTLVEKTEFGIRHLQYIVELNKWESIQLFQFEKIKMHFFHRLKTDSKFYAYSS